MDRIYHKHVLISAILLTALFGLAMDMLIPVLPNIAVSFKIDANRTQQLLTIFLNGYAFFQLIYAPISDHFGRKNILLIGLAIFTISSTAIIFINSFPLILLCRLMQAVGVASSTLSAFSIIRDFCNGKECTRAISYITAAMPFFSAVFVIIGGLLNKFYGWKMLFVFSAVITVTILIYCALCLIETREKTSKLNFKLVYNNYKTIAQNSDFWIYTIISTTIFMALLSFLYNVPFIFFSISKNYASIITTFVGIKSFFLVFGSGSVAYLSYRYSNNTIIIMGSLSMIFIGLLMILSVMLFGLNAWIFFILTYLMFIGLGMINPSSQDEIMLPFKRISGQAEALSCFIRFTISSLIANNLHYIGHTVGGLAIILMCCGLINIIVIGVKCGYLFK